LCSGFGLGAATFIRNQAGRTQSDGQPPTRKPPCSNRSRNPAIKALDTQTGSLSARRIHLFKSVSLARLGFVQAGFLISAFEPVSALVDDRDKWMPSMGRRVLTPLRGRPRRRTIS
jgi:hypothetical protein